MTNEQILELDKKIGELLEKYQELKNENAKLVEENLQFQLEREGFTAGLDNIIGKLEGI